MVNIWTRIAQIAGSRCALCHSPGNSLCRHCLAKLPSNAHSCPRCAAPLPESAATATLCANCLSSPPSFRLAISALRYAHPVDDLITAFKYRHRLSLGPVLAGILADRVITPTAPPTLLVPVPANAQRLRERGFNQAAELARHLSQRLAIPWSANLLIRIDHAAPQRGLGRAARLRNLHQAFLCRARPAQRIALIDDVMTTTATAEAASRALLDAGADEVQVWTVARTPPVEQAGARR